MSSNKESEISFDEDLIAKLVPYNYESLASSSEDDNDDNENEKRTDEEQEDNCAGNNQWCLCSCCRIMPSEAESVCYQEMNKITVEEFEITNSK